MMFLQVLILRRSEGGVGWENNRISETLFCPRFLGLDVSAHRSFIDHHLLVRAQVW
jgi:hypothetical protein